MRVKEGNSENVLRMVPGDFKYIANAKYKCHIHIFFLLSHKPGLSEATGWSGTWLQCMRQ